MSFNPFGGFPTTLTAIPHFAVGKFQQSQEPSFVSIPSSQSHLQIAVTTVDTSHLNHSGTNGHIPTSSSLQIQNQMLNNLLSKTGQNSEVFVKVEQERERSAREQQNESEENDRSGFHQSNHEKSGANNTSAVTTVTQQELGSLNEYLSRFSGPPTFPVSFQPMYKYPGELVQIQTQTQEDQNLMTDHSSSVMTPEQPQVCKITFL